jgi:hypothetical protein
MPTTTEVTGSRRKNRILLVLRRISGPGRLQSVNQTLPTLTDFSKNFHNPP